VTNVTTNGKIERIPEVEEEIHFVANTGQSSRDKQQEGFFKILGPPTVNAVHTRENLAISLEVALYKNFKNAKESLSKFRQLYSNIMDAKNQVLRDRLYLGEVLATDIIHYSHEELVNPESKAEREAKIDWHTQSRMDPLKKKKGIWHFYI